MGGGLFTIAVATNVLLPEQEKKKRKGDKTVGEKGRKNMKNNIVTTYPLHFRFNVPLLQ